MKPGIMDLNKWVEKTAGAVRYRCQQKQAPCVGFSLAFFDPMAEKEEQWNFTIDLAFDPHSEPNEDERAQLEKSFEFIMEGVRRIMSGEDLMPDRDKLV